MEWPLIQRHLLVLLVIGFLVTMNVTTAKSALSLNESEVRGLSALEDIQSSITRLAEHVMPMVVNISPIRKIGAPRGGSGEPRSRRIPGTGSGVIISADGYIVTNNHVIGEDTTEAEVSLSDKTKVFAKVIGRDKDTDIAVLKMKGNHELSAADFGDSAALRVGQWVLAVGNPLGLERTVTLGILSGIGRERLNLSKYENFLQTDAAINPGNSGGPLFNLRGEIIGINTAIIHMAQGIGFSIPSNMVSRVVTQLRAHGRVVRGWLGVGIQPMSPELAKKMKLGKDHGVLVNEVFQDEPADQAGIQPGDVIISIQGTSINTPNQLSRLVAQVGPGETASVDLLRDGVQTSLVVAIGERQENPTTASLPFESSEVSLGIDVQALTAALAAKFGIKESTGVLVSRVTRGSLAHGEGLKEGDLIKEINRRVVRSVSQFSEALQQVSPGDTILLRVIRKERAFFVVLKVLP